MNKHTTHQSSILKTGAEYRYYCTECGVYFATSTREHYLYYRDRLRIPTSYNIILKLLETQEQRYRPNGQKRYTKPVNKNGGKNLGKMESR